LRHGNVTAREAPARAVELLAQVRIPDPERRAAAYPFQLSGGMCQRIMIAMALACSPALLIADEPTTGIDVTTQAIIMDLIAELAAAHDMASILITHDLGLAAEYCQQIAVMHAGHLIEAGPTAEIFARPRHPYTIRLVAATPKPGVTLADLQTIPGSLPDLRGARIPLCRYAPRCDRHLAICDAAPLVQRDAGPGHHLACWNPA
jgi:peptide/nickel transport system ATP-binding protein